MREQILGDLLGAWWGCNCGHSGDEVDVEVHIATNDVLTIYWRSKQLAYVDPSLVNRLMVAMAGLTTLCEVSLQAAQATFIRMDCRGNYLLETFSEIAMVLYFTGW